MNMDRFEFGVPDKQDEETWTYCDLSGCDIYLGESYLEDKYGNVIKDDFETLREHAGYQRKIAGEEAYNWN